MDDTARQIQTVLGPIPPEALGTTLFHEHFFVSSAAANYREPVEIDRLAAAHRPISENIEWVRHTVVNCIDNLIMMDTEEAMSEATAVLDAGGVSLVDQTPIGVGRNPLGLRDIAEATGLNIVMGCGYYVYPTHPPYLSEWSQDDITAELVHEWRDGIAGTGIKPGILGEIGCSWPFVEPEKKVLRAAVAAQRELDCALTIHPGRNERAPDEILALVADEGGNLPLIVLCHVERTTPSTEVMRRWADSGCVLSFDLFGVEPPNRYYDDQGIKTFTDEERLDAIGELISTGKRDQIVVSHDLCFKHQLRAYGGFGRDHILRDVVPLMRERGFSDEDVHALLVDNPARVLAVASSVGV